MLKLLCMYLSKKEMYVCTLGLPPMALAVCESSTTLYGSLPLSHCPSCFLVSSLGCVCFQNVTTEATMAGMVW